MFYKITTYVDEEAFDKKADSLQSACPNVSMGEHIEFCLERLFGKDMVSVITIVR